MATWTWTGQKQDASTQDAIATDKFGFYGTAFNDAVQTGDHQTSTHVENVSNVDQCTSPHLHNTHYVDATHVEIDGGASETLSATAPTQAECPLKVTFSHASAVATSATTFWADDGATSTAVPTDVTFYAGEQTDTSWTNAEGSAAAVAVDDQGSATDHYFYLFMSASPDTVGVKTAFRLQMQLTYQ